MSTAGTYHVRVFTTASGLSNLRPSDSRTFKVASDTVSNDPLSAPGLREGYGEVHDTLSGFNIMPAGDEDWFSLTACKADTLTIETVAARLNPASPLNTVLRLFRKDGTTQVQSNDNLDGSTTDSRIQVVAPAQDTFKIEVTGSGSSTGHYDLIYRVRPGDGRTGTTCTPVVDASKSTVAVSASTIAAGQTATFTLTAKDQNGDQMAAGGSTVAFSLSGGTSNGTIGTVTDNNNGTYTATFTGEVAGTASTVNATIDGAAVTTALPTITVTAGTFTKLGFVVHPSGATAGSVIQPVIEVAAQDAYGNLVTAATGFVTVAIGNNPAGGTLFGSVSKTFLGGVAKFDDLKIDKAADDYTLTAARSGVTGATSNPFAIVPAAAQKLAFVVQPASGTGGDSIKPGIQVAVRDAFGNTVIGFNTSITLALADNPGGATVSGTPTRATQDGIATFDDIALNKAATGYTLKATATLLDSAVSTPFDIAVGPPKHLVFTTQPGSATAGAILSPEVKVTVTDNGGNIVTTASDTVTMGFGVDASGGAATLSGTKKVKPSSGVATFNNLSIDKAARDRLPARVLGPAPQRHVRRHHGSAPAGRGAGCVWQPGERGHELRDRRHRDQPAWRCHALRQRHAPGLRGHGHL
ncbi:MAG: hypothetical protein HYW52_02730 [Gemmatimonadetes bacterium]|nr:hypothetical protein [Gemmatimonadota bacterium]